MRQMFSKKQIEGIVADNVVSNLVGKDVKVNSLEQVSPNYETEFSSASSSITNIYNRIQVINNVLRIIVNVVFTNNTESSQNQYTPFQANIDVEEWLAEKLVDLKGKKVSESASTDNTIITCAEAYVGTTENVGNTWKNCKMILANRTTAKRMTVYLKNFDGSNVITIPSGGKLYMTARLDLTLI